MRTRSSIARAFAAAVVWVMALATPSTAAPHGQFRGGGHRAFGAPSGLHCGDVVTTDVSLTQDLVGCEGDGLVVGATHVRIDLNPHRIIGSDAADSAGIRDDGFSDLLVQGGTLAHFDRGVDFENANDLQMVSTQLAGDDSFGVLLTQTSSGTVVDTQISGAGQTGIQLAPPITT